MRGADTFTESPFTLHRLEDFVPADHPLRAIRQMVNEALGKMDALFAGMYLFIITGIGSIQTQFQPDGLEIRLLLELEGDSRHSEIFKRCAKCYFSIVQQHAILPAQRNN